MGTDCICSWKSSYHSREALTLGRSLNCNTCIGYRGLEHTYWCWVGGLRSNTLPPSPYSKNKYLTLRSKVKVQRRSWYATHRLMVMYPHTKYYWPISKDKNVIARTRKHYNLTFLWWRGGAERGWVCRPHLPVENVVPTSWLCRPYLLWTLCRS
jgi:hypothetical protein